MVLAISVLSVVVPRGVNLNRRYPGMFKGLVHPAIQAAGDYH